MSETRQSPNVARRVAYNTAVLFAGRVVVTLLGIVSFALIARHLSVREYGAYSLILTFVPLIGALADLGITTIGVREATRRPEERARMMGTILTLRLAIAGVSAVLLLGIAPLLPYDHQVRTGLQLASAGLFLYIVGTVPGILFQTVLRVDRQVVADVVTAAVWLGLILAFVGSGLGVHALVGAWVASVGAGCLVAYVLAFRLERFRPRIDPPAAKSFMRASLPLALVLVLSIIHFKSDAILLSLMKPLRDVGVYNYAYRFLEQLLIVPGLFIAAVFPVLTALADKDHERFEATVRKSLTFLLLLAAPASVILFVLAQPLISLIAGGHRYDAAVVPMRILVGAILFTYVNTLFVNLLIIYDLQARILLVSVVGVVANIGLNLALIPRYSYNGSATATVITEAGSAAILAAWAIRRAQLKIEAGPLLRTVVASAGMAAVTLATRNLPLIVPLAAGAAAYIALVALLRVVTREDLTALFSSSMPVSPTARPELP